MFANDMFEDLDFENQERVINKFKNKLSTKREEISNLEDECINALYLFEEGKAVISMLSSKIKDLECRKRTIK